MAYGRRYNKSYRRYKRTEAEWPSKRYGTIHVERGTPDNVGRFGADWKSSDAIQQQNRKSAGYYGKGDYKSWAKYVPRIGGAMMGAYGTRSLGGALAGWNSGAGVSRMLGLGDYGPTTGNQIIDAPHDGSMPMSVNQAEGDLTGDVYFNHREFVQNVTVTSSGAGTSGFQNVPFAINPGLIQTFPFLSQLAQNFTLYELQGLLFEYKPTSGEFGASSSNSLGKVIMATNYDPDASPFINSVQMENYDYANSCKPSCGAVHGVETKRSQSSVNMLYTRTGNSLKDKVFTDIGLFQIATEGISFGSAGTAVIGELWVTYRCKLSRANLYGSLLNLNVAEDDFLMAPQSTSLVGGIGTVAAFSQFASKYNATASGVYAKNTNAIGGSIALNSASSFTYSFPVNIVSGSYRVILKYYAGTGQAGKYLSSMTQLTNCTFAGALNYNIPYSSTNNASTATQNIAVIEITVASPSTSIASFLITLNAAGVTSVVTNDVLLFDVQEISYLTLQ